MKSTGKSKSRRGGARPGAGRTSKAEMMGLKALLDKCWTESDREACISALAKNAKGGDMESIKLLMAYAFGRPKERHEITGADGESLFKAFQGVDTDKV